MAEPRIQYAKTSDGVGIAYRVIGSGPPLVILPNITGSHLQAYLAMPGYQAFLERLAEHLQVITYDPRGVGMSQREVIDFSAEAMEGDLEAVAAHLKLETFALYGHLLAGDMPFSYGAAHPGRVTGLVYWIGQTIAISNETSRRLALIEQFMDDEWDMYVDLRVTLMFGLDSPTAKAFASVIRASHTPQSYRESIAAFRSALDSERYRQVRVPTLIAHLAAAEGPTSTARRLASGMDAAHVVAIPGAPSTLMPFVYDNEVFTTAVVDFVQSTCVRTDGQFQAPELNLNAMRAILWTDLEEHSAMMEQLGDARGRVVLREHERIAREAFVKHGGMEVKAMGDGFIAWFPSAQQALECAITLQRSIAAHNFTDGQRVKVRVGVNAGEPIVEEGDLFGASVIAAARICSQAAGGQIVVSDVVRQLVAGKGFLFTDRGTAALKGFEEPVRLYEVRWRDDLTPDPFPKGRGNKEA